MKDVATEHFWRGKKVFVTGHTGFKGSWIAMWLHRLGAEVTGYALDAPTEPNLFKVLDLKQRIHSIHGDIRDAVFLEQCLQQSEAEIVLHLAAQPLVRESYLRPVETYSVNVMGSVNLLEAVRRTQTVKAVVNVTTDKCYENREWFWGYREEEALGGYDPYSSSKACAELVTAAYRRSFFSDEKKPVAVATARAGNVIGGGDWAKDRLIPDCVKSLMANHPIQIRNPHAVRPWQHVLEPLYGYLLLAKFLYQDGSQYAEGWNFASADADAKSVGWIVKKICRLWGEEAQYEIDAAMHPHEANYLKLDCPKARQLLQWKPVWDLTQALEKTVQWFQAYEAKDDMWRICMDQIDQYEAAQCSIKE